MYYILDTDGLDNIYMQKETGLNSHIGLAMGKLWDVQKDEIDLPYRYTMSVDAEEEPRFYGWYPGSSLMQERLVETLRSAGVDNLQTFPAEIRHEDTNEVVQGYVAVNIIGRVSCANLSQSKAEPLIGESKYIEKLVIDPAKARGALMFRLHESSMIVLVHEQVVQVIKAGGFLGLTLEPIAEASGG
jgi:hypothetical protein